MTLNKELWEKDPLYFVFKNEVKGKVKMHTKRLDMKDWIKIDKSYLAQMELRKEIMKQYENEIFVSSESMSTQHAKKELLELVTKHILQRFPDKFNLVQNSNGQQGIQTVFGDIVWLDSQKDPLLIISELVQEDWCILEKNEEENYILSAGVLCFPMGWSLHRKFNNPLHVIHKPVKDFEKQLRTNVESIFEELQPHAPLWRANWVISNTLKGSLDLYSPVSHRHVDENRISQYDSNTGDELVLRVEYQTLLRLPQSNAIVFGIRTYQRPLSEFKHFPIEDSIALIDAIQNTGKDMAEYKGIPQWGNSAIQYLNSIHSIAKSKL